MKDLRSKMLGNHNLSTHGYKGKEPIWDAHDAEFT
jgi:hypothetical protein